MILTINGKNYELKFGLGFLAEMNKRHSAEIEGVQVGYGSMKLINIGLNLQDPLAFVDLIRVATAEAPQKPSNQELELFVEEQILNNTFTTTFNAIFDELKNHQLWHSRWESKRNVRVSQQFHQWIPLFLLRLYCHLNR